MEGPKQNLIFGKEFYLTRKLAGIDSYKALSLNEPKSKIPMEVILEANETKSYFIENWISPAIPYDLTTELNYNFLFSLWGKGSGNASFYFNFYILRNNTNIFIMESLRSEFLNETVCELLWQTRLKQKLLIEKNDRIILELFLYVEVIGSFSFYYDSKEFPSYLKDPTETRYFRDESFGVNGIWLRGLKTSQGTYPATHGEGKSEYQLWCKLGIRVYERLWNSTKKEITSGLPVAHVQRTIDGEGYQSANWNCPEYEFYDNRSNVLVYVYHQFEGYEWFFDNWYFRWHTEQLGASKLNATTWTVTYYWKLYWSSYPIFSRFQFYYNVGSKNSKIENFSWVEYTPVNWAFRWSLLFFFVFITFVLIVVVRNTKRDS